MNILLYALGAYAVFTLILFSFQRSLLYYPDDFQPSQKQRIKLTSSQATIREKRSECCRNNRVEPIRHIPDLIEEYRPGHARDGLQNVQRPGSVIGCRR